MTDTKGNGFEARPVEEAVFTHIISMTNRSYFEMLLKFIATFILMKIINTEFSYSYFQFYSD